MRAASPPAKLGSRTAELSEFCSKDAYFSNRNTSSKTYTYITMSFFPIRCYSCGKPIGGLYDMYMKNKELSNSEAIIKDAVEPLKLGDLMNKMGLTRTCCRSMIMGYVDLDQDTHPDPVLDTRTS
jgi:DNA-directed RNA polymerase subunit N (RpoN/RPB10)